MGSLTECERLYDSVLRLDDFGSNESLFKLAQCFIDAFDPEKLRAMLNSEDIGMVSDGLFVVREVGKLGEMYADDIRRLAQHEDMNIRRQVGNLSYIWNKSCT